MDGEAGRRPVAALGGSIRVRLLAASVAAGVAAGGTLVYDRCSITVRSHDKTFDTTRTSMRTPPVSRSYALRSFLRSFEALTLTHRVKHQYIRRKTPRATVTMADDLVKDIEETLKACKSKRPYNSLLEINGMTYGPDHGGGPF